MTPNTRRNKLALIAICIALANCGGNPTAPSQATTPSPTPAPTPAPAPAPTPPRFTFKGFIVETQTSSPVAAATVTAGTSSTQTDGSGAYLFDGSSASLRVTVTAAGYITRETTIQTTTNRIDIIRDAAPFSLI